MLGNQSLGAGEGRELPLRAVQPERRGQAPLPHHPAIKGEPRGCFAKAQPSGVHPRACRLFPLVLVRTVRHGNGVPPGPSSSPRGAGRRGLDLLEMGLVSASGYLGCPMLIWAGNGLVLGWDDGFRTGVRRVARDSVLPHPPRPLGGGHRAGLLCPICGVSNTTLPVEGSAAWRSAADPRASGHAVLVLSGWLQFGGLPLGYPVSVIASYASTSAGRSISCRRMPARGLSPGSGRA